MDTPLRVLVMIIGILTFLFLMVLIVLGSPRPNEPGFLRALRLNMWSETLAIIGYGLLHPLLLRHRATNAEKQMLMPGDGLVAKANSQNTYAVTIHAPAGSIWPWLIQMGYRRALWYAWSPMHAFPEYRHHTSPHTIYPEWQTLHVGDVLLDGDILDQCNENKGAWRVMQIDHQRAIVLYSARDFIDGMEFDPNQARPSKIHGITSWVFYIHPVSEQQARLLIRVRAELGPGILMALVGRIVFGLGDAIFERTILEGIKSRVESHSQIQPSATND